MPECSDGFAPSKANAHLALPWGALPRDNSTARACGPYSWSLPRTGPTLALRALIPRQATAAAVGASISRHQLAEKGPQRPSYILRILARLVRIGRANGTSRESPRIRNIPDLPDGL